MFKRFRVLVLFFALLLLPLGLFLHINHNTAALAEQDEIPIFLKKQTELPDCIFLSDFNRLARCIAGYDFTIGQADYPGIGNEHF